MENNNDDEESLPRLLVEGMIAIILIAIMGWVLLSLPELLGR